jgi:hypothetical protein
MNRHNQTASAAHAKTAISAYFAELGRRGGERKASTARDNGTQGGRPPLFANSVDAWWADYRTISPRQPNGLCPTS